MSEMLMGGEASGTPLETRAGSQDLAKIFQRAMAGDASGLTAMLEPFNRMGSQAFAGNFGYDPMQVGGVLKDLLINPSDATAGLFSSMEPFEERETQKQVSGIRNIFGSAGGRFSKNMALGEGQLRGDLAAGFQKNRQGALLDANAQRGNALAMLMQFMGQQQAQQLAPLQMMMQYFQPGGPIQNEGILPGLLGAAGNFYLANRMRPPAPAPTRRP